MYYNEWCGWRAGGGAVGGADGGRAGQDDAGHRDEVRGRSRAPLQDEAGADHDERRRQEREQESMSPLTSGRLVESVQKSLITRRPRIAKKKFKLSNRSYYYYNVKPRPRKCILSDYSRLGSFRDVSKLVSNTYLPNYLSGSVCPCLNV